MNPSELRNRDRIAQWIATGATSHPVAVLPLVSIQIGNYGGGAWRQFGIEAEWIALFDDATIASANAEFIFLAGTDMRDKQFPNASGNMLRIKC